MDNSNDLERCKFDAILPVIDAVLANTRDAIAAMRTLQNNTARWVRLSDLQPGDLLYGPDDFVEVTSKADVFAGVATCTVQRFYYHVLDPDDDGSGPDPTAPYAEQLLAGDADELRLVCGNTKQEPF